MSNKWFNFLSTYGATFNSEQEVTFDPKDEATISSLQGNLYLTDLSYLSLIEVSGDDKKTFLQGQLTNDVNAISSSLTHISGLCTPKGRLRALFTIISRDDTLLLQLPLALHEETLKRLKMFVMMSKVKLVDVNDSLIKIGISGNQAIKVLKENGFTIPNETNMVSDNNAIQLIRLSGTTPRFECIGPLDKIQALWETLQEDAQLIGTAHWKLLDIQSGIPNVFASSKETFIPQMLNLEALNGINFKKGCYTGQEVVARMQYLGKLKRRMYRAHCDTETLLEPGALLYSESSKSGQGAGHIVDSQKSLNGGIELLAVITTEAIDNSDIFLDESFKTPLIIKELPYTIETE